MKSWKELHKIWGHTNNARLYAEYWLVGKYEFNHSKLEKLNDNEFKTIKDVAEFLLSGKELAKWLQDAKQKHIALRTKFNMSLDDYSEIDKEIEQLLKENN